MKKSKSYTALCLVICALFALIAIFQTGCVNYGATTVAYERETLFGPNQSGKPQVDQAALVKISQEPRTKETVKFKGTFPKKMLTQGITVKLDEDLSQENEGGGVVLTTEELEAAPVVENTKAHTARDKQIGTTALKAAMEALQTYFQMAVESSDPPPDSPIILETTGGSNPGHSLLEE